MILLLFTIAKEILVINPDDTWVEKGLREMEKEVRRLDEETVRIK